jgi:hypothetical protein
VIVGFIHKCYGLLRQLGRVYLKNITAVAGNGKYLLCPAYEFSLPEFSF